MACRHDLVWLNARGWTSVLAQIPSAHRVAVLDWRAADWPLIVRQRQADCSALQMCLGIALPPDSESGIKPRLPLQIDAADIARQQRPRSLVSVLDAAFPVWRDDLTQLERAFAAEGLTVRVYGSLALQAITGWSYLRAGSDIDVLIEPVSSIQLDTALDLFSTYGEGLPLDGEIVFSDGNAVAIKEWRNARRDTAPSRVLVKRHGGVALLRSDVLLATLETERCSP